MPLTQEMVLASGHLSPRFASRRTPIRYAAIAATQMIAQSKSSFHSVRNLIGVSSGGSGSPVSSCAGVTSTMPSPSNGVGVFPSAVAKPIAVPIITNSTATKPRKFLSVLAPALKFLKTRRRYNAPNPPSSKSAATLSASKSP